MAHQKQWVSVRLFTYLVRGGDILVIRASGTDAYNPYIFSLGTVNSVATLIITKNQAASDPFVISKIKSCEGRQTLANF
jgi:hypothetical protein